WSQSLTLDPARAKLMAHARPINPAPMIAVLVCSEGFDIAIDSKGLSGNIDAGIGKQERHHAGNVVRAYHAPQRHALEIAFLHLLDADADLLGPGGNDVVDAW